MTDFALLNYPPILELRYKNVAWNLIQIEGLNQEISYSNLPEVISREFEVLKNNY